MVWSLVLSVSHQVSETSPSMGLRDCSTDHKQEAELEAAELKMLRFSLGVRRMDRKRRMSTSEQQPESDVLKIT